MLQHFFGRAKPATPKIKLFPLGSLQVSEKVLWLDDHGLLDPLPYVQRHHYGDWGDIDEVQRDANDDALRREGVLVSRYSITPRLILVVTTNHHRSITAVHLLEEPSQF